jgi:hypothetical protein
MLYQAQREYGLPIKHHIVSYDWKGATEAITLAEAHGFSVVAK